MRDEIIRLKIAVNMEIQKILDGETKSYPAYIELKRLERFVKDAYLKIEETVLDDIGDSRVEYEGYELQSKKGTKRWVFNHIDKYVSLKNKIKSVEELHKMAHDRFANGLEPLVDAETGEIIEPATVNYTKDSLILKKAKNEK